MWTKEEDKILKKYFGKNNKELYEILHNFSINTIHGRAIQLKLTNKIEKEKKDWTEDLEKDWTNEEIEILKENYKAMSRKEIFELFPDKSQKSILSMAKKLDLFLKSWSDEEKELIKELYGKNNKLLYELLEDRSVTAIRRRAWILKEEYQVTSPRVEWADEEIEILKKNYNKNPNANNNYHLLELLPNRTLASMVLKAGELGLSKKANKKAWSEEEEKIIKNFGDFKPKFVIELINAISDEKRTYKSISKKIHNTKAKKQVLLKENIDKGKKNELTLEAIKILSQKDGFLTIAEFKEIADKYNLMSPQSLSYNLKKTWKEIGEDLGLNKKESINDFKILNKKRENNKTYLYIECPFCKNKKWIRQDSLKKIKGCGCQMATTQFTIKDITNQKFGRSTALKVTDKRDKQDKRLWQCICDCGNTHYASCENLTSGKVKSCGCLKTEIASESGKEKMNKYIEKDIVEGTSLSKISREKLLKNNTSGTTGVCKDEARNKWLAQIVFKGKTYKLGRYTEKDDAIKARKKAEKELFGKFLESHKSKES